LSAGLQPGVETPIQVQEMRHIPDRILLVGIPKAALYAGSLEGSRGGRLILGVAARTAHLPQTPQPAGSKYPYHDRKGRAISRMKAEGFEPAVIVETSPYNFQAWLNHGQVLEAATSTRSAKRLAERFGGDPSSADWRHFGRLERIALQCFAITPLFSGF
jgi:hypothetical protein